MYPSKVVSTKISSGSNPHKSVVHVEEHEPIRSVHLNAFHLHLWKPCSSFGNGPEYDYFLFHLVVSDGDTAFDEYYECLTSTHLRRTTSGLPQINAKNRNCVTKSDGYKRPSCSIVLLETFIFVLVVKKSLDFYKTRASFHRNLRRALYESSQHSNDPFNTLINIIPASNLKSSKLSLRLPFVSWLKFIAEVVAVSVVPPANKPKHDEVQNIEREKQYTAT